MRSRRAIILLAILLAAGIALRLAAIHLRPEGAAARAPDESELLQIAVNLSVGDGFSFDGKPTAYRDVLFPAVASFLLRATGDPRSILHLQILLDLATALLLFLIGRRRFTENVAVGLAGAWLLYPAAILFSAMYLSETLFVFLWAACMWLYDRLDARDLRILDAILLGGLLGVLLLSRAAGIILPATIVIYLLFIRYERPLKRRARTAGVILASCLIVVLPWMIRNDRAVGKFALNTNGGINFYIGNNPQANGAYCFTPEIEAPLNAGGNGETERDRMAYSLGWSHLSHHLRDSYNLWGKKFAYLWSTDMALWAHYAPDRAAPSLASKLHAAPLGMLIVLAGGYVLILLAGTAGFYLVKKFPARGFFMLQISLGTLLGLATYGLPRYHFPYMPALIVGAGSLVRPHAWADAPPWRRLFFLMAGGVFLGIWLYEAVAIWRG